MSTQTPCDTPADILLEQLQASRVHGFPFFAYTGAMHVSQTDNMLTMQMPSNPQKIAIVTVMYVKVTDTYTVLFYQRPKIASEIKSVVENVYVDQLAETIARGTGVF